MCMKIDRQGSFYDVWLPYGLIIIQLSIVSCSCKTLVRICDMRALSREILFWCADLIVLTAVADPGFPGGWRQLQR